MCMQQPALARAQTSGVGRLRDALGQGVFVQGIAVHAMPVGAPHFFTILGACTATHPLASLQHCHLQPALHL